MNEKLTLEGKKQIDDYINGKLISENYSMRIVSLLKKKTFENIISSNKLIERALPDYRRFNLIKEGLKGKLFVRWQDLTVEEYFVYKWITG